MAGIDKTYIKTVKEYRELYEWCKSVGTVTDDYGNRIIPMDYLIPESEENVSEWLKSLGDDAEIPIWNTDCIFDLYLIRYCPIKFVQDRMNEVYDEKYIQSVKNKTSVYDTFQRNGVKNPHYKIVYSKGGKIKSKWQYWHIEITLDDISLDYDEDEDKWRHYAEAFYGKHGYPTMYFSGRLDKKKLHRWIKKWNLPKGSIVQLYCFDNDLKKIEFTVK